MFGGGLRRGTWPAVFPAWIRAKEILVHHHVAVTVYAWVVEHVQELEGRLIAGVSGEQAQVTTVRSQSEKAPQRRTRSANGSSGRRSEPATTLSIHRPLIRALMFPNLLENLGAGGHGRTHATRA